MAKFLFTNKSAESIGIKTPPLAYPVGEQEYVISPNDTIRIDFTDYPPCSWTDLLKYSGGSTFEAFCSRLQTYIASGHVSVTQTDRDPALEALVIWRAMQSVLDLM